MTFGYNKVTSTVPFVGDVFNDAVSSSGYTKSNGVVAEMGKDTEGGGHNLVKANVKDRPK
jgi:hypothetical protein